MFIYIPSIFDDIDPKQLRKNHHPTPRAVLHRQDLRGIRQRGRGAVAHGAAVREDPAQGVGEEVAVAALSGKAAEPGMVWGWVGMYNIWLFIKQFVLFAGIFSK